ncbi:MAG: rod-binding protein [Burkholderiaceae bacterium]|nr:rod-binding protein [Burkholderiaceae bacterium]
MNSIDSAISGLNGPPADAAAPAANPVDPHYAAKATRAALQFEGFFISHMLRQMRSSSRELAGDDALFKSDANNDLLDMADNMVADQMAGQRAFGVADAILRQLLPKPAGQARAALAPENLPPPLNKTR